jgi:DNA-binding FadR family transcriptional regulator
VTVPTAPMANAVSLAELRGIAAQVGELKSERVVKVLEQQILNGTLPVGAKLPTETELGELLGVSRTVVRDAVRVLVARGLLNVRQGSGTTVAQASDQAFSSALLALLARSDLTMGDVIAARASIEIGLVGMAAKSGTDEDWLALESAYDRLAAAAERGDLQEASRAHAEFHNLIIAAIHQPALNLILHPMSELTLVSGNASVFLANGGTWEVECHFPILEALRSGDAAAATAAMRIHFEQSTRADPYRPFLDRPFRSAFHDDELAQLDRHPTGTHVAPASLDD